MIRSPNLKLSGIVLDSPDAQQLAAFYQRLLGWEVEADEQERVKLRSPDGGPGLSFQSEPDYVPPVWPTNMRRQQIMAHLDIEVDDLIEAGKHAEAAGGILARRQPKDNVRVYLDPAGHPFCLWARE